MKIPVRLAPVHCLCSCERIVAAVFESKNPPVALGDVLLKNIGGSLYATTKKNLTEI
jgi:predicted metal-binding protein